jgi:hypothetical protein
MEGTVGAWESLAGAGCPSHIEDVALLFGVS